MKSTDALSHELKNISEDRSDRVQEVTTSYHTSKTGVSLPERWTPMTLGEVVESMKNGIYKPSSAYCENGVACLRMYNIEAGKIVWKDIKRMRLTENELNEYSLKFGDLLVNRVNSRELVGKTAVIPAELERCVFESKNIRVRLKTKIAEPRFVSFAMLAHGQAHFMRNAQQVVGMASISQPQVAAFPIAMPSLEDQQRIVAEIEKQFTRLDAGVASLKRVRANLKRYRASVLKAACEARLVSSDSSWRKTQIRDAVQIIDYRGRTPPFSGEGIPHLRSQNVRNGRIVWNDLTYVTEESYAAFMTRGLPKRGDLLFTTEAPMGEVALAPEEKFSVAQRIMILRPDTTILTSQFLMVQLRSPQFQARLRHSGTGSTVTGVSSRNFQPLPLLLPSLIEQHRIVDEVERRLSVIEELESIVDANLQRAVRLQQAILQKAFSGELIASDQKITIDISPTLISENATKRPNRHFARALLSAEIVHHLHGEPTFGRIKHQKIFHLCEHIVQLTEIEGQYHREAAGPLDNKLIYANEAELKKQRWYQTIPRVGHGHAYEPLPKSGGHRKYLEGSWPDKIARIEGLIELMRTWTTERCEIFSTAYAAWNDLLIWGQEPTHQAILREITERWHPSKDRIEAARWFRAIEWIKKEGFAPTGFGKATRETN